MHRMAVEVLAGTLGAVFVVAATIVPVSKDEDVAFFVALIGGFAVWEIARFILARRLGST